MWHKYKCLKTWEHFSSEYFHVYGGLVVAQ